MSINTQCIKHYLSVTKIIGNPLVCHSNGFAGLSNFLQPMVCLLTVVSLSDLDHKKEWKLEQEKEQV